MERTLDVMNEHLKTRTFFVTERITLADISVATVTQKACGMVMDAKRREKYPNLIRHMETVINQPDLKSVYGETQYTEKQMTFVPPPKEKKEKAPAQPKAEKKPKKEVETDDEEEPDVPPEPKQKNPLDDLPKSAFNLEDWKRAYSNKETRGPDGALEWFYNKCGVAATSYRGLTMSIVTTPLDSPSGRWTSNITTSLPKFSCLPTRSVASSTVSRRPVNTSLGPSVYLAPQTIASSLVF